MGSPNREMPELPTSPSEWLPTVALDPTDKVGGRKGTTQMIPLRLVAAQGGEQVPGRLILHAFGYDLQAQTMAKIDRCPHDREVIIVRRHVADKRAVDLDLIDS